MGDIRFNNPLDGQWLAALIHCGFDPGVDRCIARPGIGGMIYSGYTGTAIFCHFGGHRGWITRELLYVGFAYPFLQLKCQQIHGLTPSTNQRAMQVNHKLGFREETRIRGAIPGGDIVVVSMRREDCRWLKPPSQLAAPQQGRSEYGSFQGRRA